MCQVIFPSPGFLSIPGPVIVLLGVCNYFPRTDHSDMACLLISFTCLNTYFYCGVFTPISATTCTNGH